MSRILRWYRPTLGKRRRSPFTVEGWMRTLTVVTVACFAYGLADERTALATDEPAPRPSNETTDSPQRPPLRMAPLPRTNNEAHLTPWPANPGQLALTVGVPFFDDDLLHGDLAVDLRYGHKFGWFVPYLSGGFRQTRMDPARVPHEVELAKLLSWHVTAGLRLEIPATKRLFPFVGLGVEMAYWAYTEDSTTYCHESFYPKAWRCYEPFDWKAGRAIKLQLGFSYQPEPALALEFWLERATVTAPGMFTRSVTILSPGVGIAWHH